ncbi:hypothetical protein [Bacillus toyonensis]|uniref:hypothetical protein n=1 Tax=Bacillus toyonensis TaxID=155322 RepID=UPI002E245452|nr:hypothetical protein [Bacillus toyonensis]
MTKEIAEVINILKSISEYKCAEIIEELFYKLEDEKIEKEQCLNGLKLMINGLERIVSANRYHYNPKIAAILNDIEELLPRQNSISIDEIMLSNLKMQYKSANNTREKRTIRATLLTLGLSPQEVKQVVS